MKTIFVILAAGNSRRFKSKIPKQFNNYKGKMILEHSIDKAIKSKIFKRIILVVNKSHKKFIKKIKNKNITIIFGGKERSDSSFKAIKYLKKIKPNKIFIHDAARPNFSIKLLKKLSKLIKKNKVVVPYIKINDSIKFKNKFYENLDRNKIFLTQTPQCFDYNLLEKNYFINKENITDEVSIFIKKKIKIKFTKGEKRNFKITDREDCNNINKTTFYGIGFDIHRLIKNKKLYLGGTKIPYHSGLKGHSDGDVILHAIIDALLGAMKKNDIGTLYPDNEDKFRNIRSPKMLLPIIADLSKKNFYINNIDINLICEKPKVSIYRKKILTSLSKLMCISKNKINIKGKTVEKLGLIGKEKAIACEAIVSIIKYE
tara:strand:+ start:60 stop:1175 length:1116 start_codon:yes stop_codon:yes gene_type:complete